MTVRAALCVGAAALMASCGSPSVSKADVTISMDGAPQSCKVALSKEAQASSVACAELVPFLRDELRLPSGAIYELRSDRTVEPSQVAAMTASLNSAGYRSAP